MKKNTKLLILLLCLALFMFAFSFALVPFYNILCKALGINGKPNTEAVINTQKIDATRIIHIQLLANPNSQLPWDFYPEKKQMTVHPGENIKLFYVAKNKTNYAITAQAVPSISPSTASKYVKKIECFCFRKQTLQAHQQIKMPVIFYVEPNLPKKITEITLSYSMYPIK